MLANIDGHRYHVNDEARDRSRRPTAPGRGRSHPSCHPATALERRAGLRLRLHGLLRRQPAHGVAPSEGPARGRLDRGRAARHVDLVFPATGGTRLASVGWRTDSSRLRLDRPMRSPARPAVCRSSSPPADPSRGGRAGLLGRLSRAPAVTQSGSDRRLGRGAPPGRLGEHDPDHRPRLDVVRAVLRILGPERVDRSTVRLGDIDRRSTSVASPRARSHARRDQSSLQRSKRSVTSGRAAMSRTRASRRTSALCLGLASSGDQTVDRASSPPGSSTTKQMGTRRGCPRVERWPASRSGASP